MERAVEFESFWEKGYLVVRRVFEKDEMQVIKRVVDSQPGMSLHAEDIRRKISRGERPSFETIFVWNDTSNYDVFSKAVRSHKIVERLECFYQDEVYVYHNKVTLKYPGVVGFLYHQDYAYWYNMGNLYPDMAAVFIAVDESTRKNGCLRIIEGSHKLGRIDHIYNNGVSDSGACPDRLKAITQRLPEVYVELNIGDVVFFHCNTLHGSDDNHSSDSRIALIGTYNTKHNDPYIANLSHPRFQVQAKVYGRITEDDGDNLPDFELDFSARANKETRE